MVNFDNSDTEFIKENFENPEEILSYQDVNDVLDALQDLIMVKGIGDDDYPNAFGEKTQRVYDNIYRNN